MNLNPIHSAITYFLAHPDTFGAALLSHVSLSATALSIALLLAFPLGVWVSSQSGRMRLLIPLFSSLRVIPSLAILALSIPLLGAGITAALLALILLAIPPILINTASGLSQIDPNIREVALGLGMKPQEIFNRVLLPLALPSILTGVRTATVEVIASATLAALIGAGGLGIFIINGLSMYHFGLLLVGTLPVVMLALLAEIGFSQLEKHVTRYQPC